MPGSTRQVKKIEKLLQNLLDTCEFAADKSQKELTENSVQNKINITIDVAKLNKYSKLNYTSLDGPVYKFKC